MTVNKERTPEAIAREIIFNDDVFKLWDKIAACKDRSELEALKDILTNDSQKTIVGIILSQVRAYKDRNLSEAGFQLPEPYCGDIGNAEVVFLSSNPGFTPNERFPRYHGGDKGNRQYSWYGLKQGHPEKKEASDLTETVILDFFKKRFSENIKSKQGSLATVDVLKNGDTESKPVLFWENLVIFSAKLQGLGDVQISEARKCDDEEGQFAKKVLKKMALIDVVPYKSQSEIGVHAIIKDYMKNHTQYLLAKSEAGLVILVGSKVKNAFLEVLNQSQSIIKTDVNVNTAWPLYVTIGGQSKMVMWVPHFSHRVYSEKYKKGKLHECLPPIIYATDFEKIKERVSGIM